MLQILSNECCQVRETMKSIYTPVAFLLLLDLALLAKAEKTNCPEQDGTFENWDSVATWANGAVRSDIKRSRHLQPETQRTEKFQRKV